MKKLSKKVVLLLAAAIMVFAMSLGVSAASSANSSYNTGISKSQPADKAVLSISRTSLSLNKGKSYSIVCGFTKYGYLTYKIANTSIVSCKWGNWYDNGTHIKLTITGKAVGSTYVYVTNSYNTEKRTLKVNVLKPPTTTTNPVTRRAVVIGEASYPNGSALPACRYDANGMEMALKKAGYSNVCKKVNASKATIKAAITSTFRNCDSNDVSMFYYSGHGSTSDGSIVPFSGSTFQYITPTELASWLKKVPGTIIVVLDSCGSGAVINKGNVTPVNLDTFNSNVVNAFAAQDTVTKLGEMCSSKFRVLTACQKYKTSICYSNYSVFTRALVEGAGYDYFSGAKKTSAPADGNKNKLVTLRECYVYLTKKVDPYYQKAQYYPANSTTTVFKR